MAGHWVCQVLILCSTSPAPVSHPPVWDSGTQEGPELCTGGWQAPESHPGPSQAHLAELRDQPLMSVPPNQTGPTPGLGTPARLLAPRYPPSTPTPAAPLQSVPVRRCACFRKTVLGKVSRSRRVLSSPCQAWPARPGGEGDPHHERGRGVCEGFGCGDRKECHGDSGPKQLEGHTSGQGGALSRPVFESEWPGREERTSLMELGALPCPGLP